jgi:acyl transferase domain-containing protein
MHRELADWSLLEELAKNEGTTRLEETSIAQPIIFVVQVALAKLWQSWGIEPSAVGGHSVGEVAAHTLRDSFLRDATLSITRLPWTPEVTAVRWLSVSWFLVVAHCRV